MDEALAKAPEFPIPFDKRTVVMGGMVYYSRDAMTECLRGAQSWTDPVKRPIVDEFLRVFADRVAHFVPIPEGGR